jgi:hypothetical protein
MRWRSPPSGDRRGSGRTLVALLRRASLGLEKETVQWLCCTKRPEKGTRTLRVAWRPALHLVDSGALGAAAEGDAACMPGTERAGCTCAGWGALGRTSPRVRPWLMAAGTQPPGPEQARGESAGRGRSS